MFNRLKLILENNDLEQENKTLCEENKQNRNDIKELEIQKVHAKLLAEYTLTKLLELEEIDRSGNTEESKRKRRNIVYNDLRKQNIDILKELSNKFGSGR